MSVGNIANLSDMFQGELYLSKISFFEGNSKQVEKFMIDLN